MAKTKIITFFYQQTRLNVIQRSDNNQGVFQTNKDDDQLNQEHLFENIENRYEVRGTVTVAYAQIQTAEKRLQVVDQRIVSSDE